jgi:transposase
MPTLRKGDIVIMDNLGSHKAKAVRQLIRLAGAKLFFLPKYSPDLDPICHGSTLGLALFRCWVAPLSLAAKTFCAAMRA